MEKNPSYNILFLNNSDIVVVQNSCHAQRVTGKYTGAAWRSSHSQKMAGSSRTHPVASKIRPIKFSGDVTGNS